MKRIIAIVCLVAVSVTMSCAKEGGPSRPAPNSVPVVPPPAPGTPAQEPAKSGGKPEVPKEPIPGTVKTPETATTPAKPTTDPQVTSSRLLKHDNGGSSQGTEKIKGKTFFVKNFDPIHVPMSRQVITTTTSDGKERTTNGKDVTHLSDERYINCTRPECVAKIDSAEEFNYHSESCWVPSFAPELARFEFSFSKDGTLRFAGNINGIRYGATNIEYSYNGKRRLYIAPFLATGVINENENLVKAIKVSAVPGHGYTEAGVNIFALSREIEKNEDAYKIKSTIAIDHGSFESGRFVPGANSRRYVGGLRSHLEPISPTNFKVFDVQE